jgi:hypothetical protein
VKEEYKFLPLYAQARQRVQADTTWFLNKIGFALTDENVKLARSFSDQIVSIHDEIIRQHNWAFNELVKTTERSCTVPDILFRKDGKDE